MPRLSLSPRATLTTTNTNTNMNYPTTLADIRKAAASMFADPAVISINIIASFGEVTVYRNGRITMTYPANHRGSIPRQKIV